MHNVDFSTAIKLFFANYANFKGRSTRAEYWWAMLFVFLVSMVISFVGSNILTGLVGLAFLLPELAILTRRFHDTGRSGWWIVGLCLVSVIGVAIVCASLGTSMLAMQNDPEAIAGAVTANIGMVSLGYVIMLAAGIVSLIFTLLPSGPDNKYGPNPYAEA